MPDIAWRKKIWDIVNSTPFDILIMSFIVLNMIQMGLTYEGAPQSVLEFLRISNYVFTAVFLAEAILKLLAYDWSYFGTAWNKFDFFVVCASLLDIMMDQLP
jgi:ABC-type multidrug transport system permease subunit